MVLGFGKSKQAPPAEPAPVAQAVEEQKQSLLTADIQDMLLKDASVKAMMQKAGEAGLSDPAVQKQILDTCRDKFPEYAANAKEQVTAWASDPDTQAKAKAYAGVFAKYAAVAGDALMKQIEQGPAGVRVISFFTSLASAINAIWGLIDGFSLTPNIVAYTNRIYQLMFAFTTMLFEAKPEWLVTFQDKTGIAISSYQDLLLDNAKFLALAGGRGLFYLYQGTLWLAASGYLEHPVNLAVGIALVLVGILHLLMHCGIAPIDIATKMRSGYSQLESGVRTAGAQ